MDRHRPRLTYANVVSTICLFVLLGGSAWAATGGLGKNSVGTPQLKNGAVTGAKVKDGSLTGADIKSATIGTVPKAQSAETSTSAEHAMSAEDAAHAATATSAGHAAGADSAATAGDATTLDGVGPGAFYPAGSVQRIAVNPAYGAPPTTVYSADGLVLTVRCEEGGTGGSTSVFLTAASTAPGARAEVSYVERLNGASQPVLEEFVLGSAGQRVWSSFASLGGSSPGKSVGTLDYTDSSRSVDFTLQSSASPAHECQVSGVAAVNG